MEEPDLRGPEPVRIPRSREPLIAATFRRRGCGLLFDSPESGEPEIGTGTAIRHGSAVFILTCQHVASRFFAGGRGLARFGTVDQIDRSGLDPAFENEELDLAIIRVKPQAAARLDLSSQLVLADLGTRDDYERLRPGDGRFQLAGFPADQVITRPILDGRGTYFELTPMVYNTVILERRSTVLHLGYHGEAPAAPGISGSLIYEVPTAKPGELLVPGLAIAMQHSWIDDASRIMASPLHVLRDVIARMAGE